MNSIKRTLYLPYSRAILRALTSSTFTTLHIIILRRDIAHYFIMQLYTFLAIIAPVIVTVQAGCFSGGANWDPTKNAALDIVDRICNGGGVSGGFGAGQTKNSCQNMRDNARAQFEVQWTGGGGQDLNDDECKTRLKNEINGCGHGGETVTGGWRYK
jgi:hypothetical protein